MTNEAVTSNHHKIKVVLFDLGSTLIYFDSTWQAVSTEMDQATVDALQRAGLNVDRERFIADLLEREAAFSKERNIDFIEYSTLYILRTTLAGHGYPQPPEDVLHQIVAEMYSVSQAHWHAEADAASTLDALRQEGYRMGIVSNAGDDQDVHTLIERAKLGKYFDVVISSAAAGIRKPHPGIFDMTLAHWGFVRDQAVMVGDTLGADILGAHNAGMPGIWISRRADRPDNHAHLDTILPDATIAALSELPELLKRMQSS
jgi:HAD superfamily hydrolase (TIGR01549 family)